MKKYQQLAVILSLGLSLIACKDISVKDPASLPVAIDDTATITENAAAISILVLANDTSSGQLDVSSVEIITSPQHGSATVTNTGEVQYTPNSNYYGSDSFIYTVKDTDGNFSNPATVEITITRAPDITAPVITINGGDETIEACTTYTDAGATALDDRDGNVIVTSISTVMDNLPGSYTVTYRATDAANNTATAIRNVVVVDTTAPVITINGSPSVSIAKPGPYNDAGVTVVDCTAAPVTVISTVDVNTVGNYTVTYTATDSQGITTQAVRDVAVTPQTLTRKDPHTHANCLGHIVKSGLDTNDNDVLDKNEVTSEVSDYFEGTPVTRVELDTMIANDADVTNINTCEIVDMSSMFFNNTTFNQDISLWNVGSVTTMVGMFNGASAFNQNIGSWDVSNVTNMSWMFNLANSFNQDIGGWNVSKVTAMEGMFNTNASFNQNIGSWNVGSVTNMSWMFRDASTFNQDISGWDVSNVTDMSSMFSVNTVTVFNQDIGIWNVSSVTDMNRMFNNATSFDQDIGGWDVSKVTDMSLMFKNVTLSVTNYDNLLNGWWTNLGIPKKLQNSVTFDAGNSKYSTDASAAHVNILTKPIPGWTITDGGCTDCFIIGVD